MDTIPAPLLPMPNSWRVRRPIGHVFRVEVQILGLALVHRWTGFAEDSEQATQRGFDEARQLYVGRSLCVRGVTQIGI